MQGILRFQVVGNLVLQRKYTHPDIYAELGEMYMNTIRIVFPWEEQAHSSKPTLLQPQKENISKHSKPKTTAWDTIHTSRHTMQLPYHSHACLWLIQTGYYCQHNNHHRVGHGKWGIWRFISPKRNEYWRVGCVVQKGSRSQADENIDTAYSKSYV